MFYLVRPEIKALVFVGSSRKDLRKFPKTVIGDIGYDLDAIQCGQTPMTAKRLKGLPGVMELIERYDKDTYRVVYVVNINNKIYVLHCFKKKAKRGIQAPKEDMDVIRRRLKEVKEITKGG